MENSVGSYVKIVFKYITPGITILLTIGIIVSVLFNLTYFYYAGGRVIFLMTLADYPSLSIAIIPLIIVPVTLFSYLCLAYLVPSHIFIWLERNNKWIYALTVLIVIIAGFSTLPTDVAILLIPFYMIALSSPTLTSPTQQKTKDQFNIIHAILTILYIGLFVYLLASSYLLPLVPFALLVLISEAWILIYVSGRPNPLWKVTVYLCHGDLPPGTGHSARESWWLIVPVVGLGVISAGACPC